MKKTTRKAEFNEHDGSNDVSVYRGFVWLRVGRLTAPTREDVYSAAEQIYEAGYDDGINDRRR